MYRFFSLLLTLLVSVPAFAQVPPAIRYELGWGAPNDHWLNVTMHVADHDGDVLDVRIPHWRPGTYIVQNYARDIVGIDAHTASGAPLASRKIDRDTWRIDTGGVSDIAISYRQWADQLDAGASYVGQGRLSLNPITALMNVPGRELEPASIHLDLPDGWSVATALDYDAAINGWRASDYHELVDSPILASPDHVAHAFDVAGKTIEIVVHGEWSYDPARLIDHHRRIVEAQVDIMGDLPFDRYVFLYQFLAYPSGHGVEHRNSTSIVLGPAAMAPMPEDMSNPGFYRAVLGVASHEFFHLWNVERIRPAAMEPTDYSREQYTTQMWIFEGVTDYYADLALLRAGLISRDAFLTGLGHTVHAFHHNPGRKVTSVAMSSFDSWAKQDDPSPFTWYSFYTAGKALGLALDLEVRGRTGGERSLDDVMRHLYETYHLAGAGVPEDGFLRALEHVTGTSFGAFFSAHIDGTEDVDWSAYLARAGYMLVESPDERRPVTLGVNLDDDRISAVRPGSAAFHAGLDIDDRIVAVNGQAVEDPTQYGFGDYAPGDVIELTVDRYGTERTVSVTLDATPPVFSFKEMDKPSTDQRTVREGWLATRGM